MVNRRYWVAGGLPHPVRSGRGKYTVGSPHNPSLSHKLFLL
ncbi:hypothetical protein LEP1GSC196_3569 [Leptospira meyeri serovar Semaranga str. Veldrot Semarang 173]|nr:hypothetical protein LEP1GSC196_3569 [Leptospira meyeri serovar Semaranga str. Veldrot Semarang 173]